ncbi:MAG: DUF5110 domain-containing protein [Butyrivibrio sp.]|nr:DUF5110 domain-containing protein [Butyrivibrio sp.]
MITGKNYRITVLTNRLIRLEYSEKNEFVDKPTQVITNREFDEALFDTDRNAEGITINTGKLVLRYDEKEFSMAGLSITVTETGKTWHFGEKYGNSDGNLFGTARTLDGADGGLWLEEGIFGRNGFAVLNDSDSALLIDGEFVDRSFTGTDIYFFGYGNDFRQGLKDYFALTGEVPMVPRYVFGNWWSRYHAYTEESYNELIDKMQEEHIPFSVAVIDMDWHVTDVDPKYGTGWTGFSWNKDLFPDYKRFLAHLREKKLSVTLNLHPADGIRAFEDQYEAAAKRLGVDPKSEKPLEFDFADKAFRDAYFEEVIHPFEDDGVGFWWIDWQQGTKSGKSNIDPLFLLNHYHYEDGKREGKRGLIFSRYSGPGSQRYPIGFSGDTISSWKSLAFQPYFTFTASNIGYGFWSHDIGGHMMGDKDEERLIRWIQFGVFSPIMRLHSSNSPFFNKEPWNVSEPYRTVMGNFMRLRHRLIPYIYTMSHKAHTDGQLLIEPMYYRHPDKNVAFEVKQEYYFGDSLLVGAIVKKSDPMLRMGHVNMYIPEGRFYDIFTGYIYTGEKRANLYRTVDSIPVLLPEGGIVAESLEDDKNGCDNPERLRILVGYGKNGKFELYEDDGESYDYEDGHSVTTLIESEVNEKECTMDIRINPAKGDCSLIPQRRSYEIVVYGIEKYECDVDSSFDEKKKCLTIRLPEAEITELRDVRLTGIVPAENDIVSRVFEVIERSWCDTLVKERIFDRIKKDSEKDSFLSWLRCQDVDENLKDAISEAFL